MEKQPINTKCSFCKKEFDEWDEQQNFNIDFYGMFGSRHDGEHIKIHLCCECADKIIDEYILPKAGHCDD